MSYQYDDILDDPRINEDEDTKSLITLMDNEYPMQWVGQGKVIVDRQPLFTGLNSIERAQMGEAEGDRLNQEGEL